MAHLFTPFTLKSAVLRNRVGLSPMCQYSAENGEANDWHLAFYGARAAGGVGLAIVEATAVAPEGRITPGDLGLWADRQVEPLARVLRFVKRQGAVPGLQLAHAGRKASAARPQDGAAHLSDADGGWPVIAPSALPFGGDLKKVPSAMTEADIARVQGDFAAAAKRALAAGCEWLELHAGHGYLCCEFLSPLTNRRDDGYGGSFDNRIRFMLETVRGMRAVWPERLPFSVRISCTEWMPGGWDLEQSTELARRLKTEGVDLIDCSSGGNAPDARIPVGPGFQIPFAEHIRQCAGTPTSAVGLIVEPEQADTVVRQGRADLVLLGRELLRDPNWPLRTARALGHASALLPLPQYSRAF